MRSALILVATTSIAHASPPEQALGEQQLQLRAWEDVLAEGDAAAHREWARFAGFAQLTGGGHAGGDVGAGAAVALGGIKCELVAATAHGRFRPLTDDGEPMGQVTYSVCPLAALFTLKFDGHRAAGIAPGLAERRSLWNRAYTDVYDRFTFAAGPFWGNDPQRAVFAPEPALDDGDPEHTIFVFSLGHGTTTQRDGFETRTTKKLDFDFTAYRFVHPAGFGIDVLALTADALKAGTDNKGGVASSFLPLRVRYETPALYARAQAGWGWTGGQLTGSGSTMVDGKTVSSWEETIDSEGLPDITDWVGEVEAGMKHGRLQASGRVARGFFPTFDGNVARESRVSGNVTWTAGRSRRTTVSLAPFAARTRTWERDAGSSREISAGAQVHVGREINQKLRVDAIGEAGVSPYARAESERLPGGYFGGQFLIALTGRVTPLQR